MGKLPLLPLSLFLFALPAAASFVSSVPRFQAPPTALQVPLPASYLLVPTTHSRAPL